MEPSGPDDVIDEDMPDRPTVASSSALESYTRTISVEPDLPGYPGRTVIIETTVRFDPSLNQRIHIITGSIRRNEGTALPKGDVMHDAKSDLAKVGVTLCTQCRHATGLGYFDRCHGTPKKEVPDYVRGDVNVLFFNPAWKDYFELEPYLREVNRDGQCPYFRQKPVQPDTSTARTFVQRLRGYFRR